MAATTAEAKFNLSLEGNASEVSEETAQSLESLRERVVGSTNAIKAMQGSLRALRGSSDEVKSAKEQLKARIDAERNAISAANLTILKAGTSYTALADRVRNARDATASSSKALSAVGGPLQGLVERFKGLKEILGGAGSATGLFVVGTVALIAACAAVTVAIAGMAVSFGQWILEAANAARSMNLVREAATGSAENARNLGTQVDVLAKKVSTPKAELNDLAVSLTRTRLSGAAIVDTFNLVGQASAGMGADVGRTLQEIVTRGQAWNRFQLNPLELQGTGLQFQDVAKQLAVQMHVGIKDAQAALFEGRVKLDDGAKALRTAVEARFAEINARKMLDLNVQLAKLKETFAELTQGISFEPLVRAVADFFSLFSQSTVTGSVLKELVTMIGTTLVQSFTTLEPIAKNVFRGMVLAALDFTIALLTVGLWIKKTFGGPNLSTVDLMSKALLAGKVVVWGLVAAVGVLAVSMGLALAPLLAGVAVFYVLYRAGQFLAGGLSLIADGFADLASMGANLASNILDGLVSGLLNGVGAVTSAVKGLADKVKSGFAEALQIHSPSRVFMQFGENTALGFSQGVDAGSDQATASVDSLVSMPAGSQGGKVAGGSVTVQVTIQMVQGKNDAKEVGSESFADRLADTLERALKGTGIPSQTVPT